MDNNINEQSFEGWTPENGDYVKKHAHEDKERLFRNRRKWFIIEISLFAVSVLLIVFAILYF